MAGLIETLCEPGSAPWLDYTAYAGALLAGGTVPWTRVDGAVTWLRQSQSLLRSAVVAVPVAEIARAWLDRNPALGAAMAGRSRAIFPLKTLLADAGLRGLVKGLFEAGGASLSSWPLVPVIPSPRAWVAGAYGQAFPSAEIEIDDDAIDSAASYIADFLRGLPQTVVGGVLLDESGEATPLSAEIVGLYQPIFNIASHYRWDVGIYAPQPGTADLIGATALAAPDFWITPDAVARKPCGVILAGSFWTGTSPPARPAGGFRFATIPADARPEWVLERLALLR